jgi:hypothetical protein
MRNANGSSRSLRRETLAYTRSIILELPECPYFLPIISAYATYAVGSTGIPQSASVSPNATVGISMKYPYSSDYRQILFKSVDFIRVEKYHGLD